MNFKTRDLTYIWLDIYGFQTWTKEYLLRIAHTGWFPLFVISSIKTVDIIWSRGSLLIKGNIVFAKHQIRSSCLEREVYLAKRSILFWHCSIL